MTSEPSPAECYVYVTLSGSNAQVTAGRYELAVNRNGIAIGRFVYGRSYLARSDAVPLDPVELKLASRVYETTSLGGLFGALRDAGPDYWGRRVIERHSGKVQLSELDYLLHSPDDRAGALGFGLNQVPPAPKRAFNQTLELPKLQAIADALIRDEEMPDEAAMGQVEELLLVGTSMGGARPKVVVEDDEGLWLAKFNRLDDRWNTARVEHSMLILGRACGLTTAESKLIRVADRDVLLVKRFDRKRHQDGGYQKARMISALTLLRTEDSHRSRDKWSYLVLVEELRRASVKGRQDAAELFRRVAYHALISNTDDHPRNHAMIAWDRDWRLSPAYDLTPTTPISLERRDLALVCGDAGRYANGANLLSQCPRFLLGREEGQAIIVEMKDRVLSKWREVARKAGVTPRDCEILAGAFVYPGFDLPIDV